MIMIITVTITYFVVVRDTCGIPYRGKMPRMTRVCLLGRRLRDKKVFPKRDKNDTETHLPARSYLVASKKRNNTQTHVGRANNTL